MLIDESNCNPMKLIGRSEGRRYAGDCSLDDLGRSTHMS